MMWISVGGAIFLGVYDKVRQLVIDMSDTDKAVTTDR